MGRWRLHALACSAALALSTAACGDDDSRPGLPYRPDETVLIGPDGIVVERTPDGDACIELANGECIRPQDECGPDAHANVLLDAEGRPIEIVCLPAEDETAIVYVEERKAIVPDNGAVVILGDEDLAGDLTVEGNRGLIYGDSPAEAVLDGDLDLKGNESIVRGLTVTGDVTFDGNTAELYHCMIHGNLVLRGNRNLVSNCVIFGSIRGSGSDDEVVSNYVQGEITFDGHPAACRDNLGFEDRDRDHQLDEQEIAAAEPLDCG